MLRTRIGFRVAIAGLVAAALLAPVAVAVSVARRDVHQFDPTTLPACLTEDSDGPCYWDATTRGNGAGRSFWVDERQRVHFIDAR